MRVRLADIKEHIDAVRAFLDPPLGPDAQPVEVRAAVVDAVDSHIAVLDVGRIVFPYNRLAVCVITGPGRDRAALEIAFGELDRKIRERFGERRCDVPPALSITMSIVDQPPADWMPGQLFSIAYERIAPSEPKADAAWPLLTLTVVTGTAAQGTYSFRQATVLIGRSAEALDTTGRVRRNDVVFDDRNPSVSRAHAMLKYDAAQGRYRVVDERSTRGTHVVRAGAIIPVLPDARGIRLESGDEVHFGRAAVRVAID